MQRTPITGTPYFIDSWTGAPRVYREAMEKREAHVSDPPKKILYEVYVKPDGTVFELPLNEADDGKSVINREENTNRGQRNLYLGKGFRFATSAEDILVALERARAGKAMSIELRKSRNPLEQTKRMGEAMAGAMEQTLAKMARPPRGSAA